jgi:hypothetical protein
MQRNIISGTISIPEQKRQKQLHRQLGEFAQLDAKTKGCKRSAERQAGNPYQ